MQFPPVRLQAFISFDNGENFTHKLSELRGFLAGYLQPLERYLCGEITNFADINAHAFGYYNYWAFGLFVPETAGQVLVFPRTQDISDRLQAIKGNRFAKNYNHPNAPLFLENDLAQWEHAPLTEMDLIWAKLYENKNN